MSPASSAARTPSHGLAQPAQREQRGECPRLAEQRGAAGQPAQRALRPPRRTSAEAATTATSPAAPSASSAGGSLRAPAAASRREQAAHADDGVQPRGGSPRRRRRQRATPTSARARAAARSTALIAARGGDPARCGREHTLPPMARSDLDRARHRARRSRRRAAAHRPAAARPRGASAAARAAAAAEAAPRPRRRAADASPPRPPRSALAAAGRRGGVPIIVPRGGGRLLLRRGFDAVREIAPGEEIARRSAERAGDGGAPSRRPRRRWARAGPALGYVITGLAPHLPRGRHRPLRRHARDRRGRAWTSRSCRSGAGARASAPVISIRCGRPRRSRCSARAHGGARSTGAPTPSAPGPADRRPTCARRWSRSWRPRASWPGRPGRAARARRVARALRRGQNAALVAQPGSDPQRAGLTPTVRT